MNREELMKKTKEQLVMDLLNAEYEIKRQEEVINDLNNFSFFIILPLPKSTPICLY